MIRVLLLDDHELSRTGYRLILEGGGDIAVVGEAACGEDALPLVRHLQPHVLLCDLYLPGMSGLTVAQRVLATSPATRIVVLSAQEEGPVPRHTLELGVHGYLSKGCAPHELRAAVRAVHAGERFVGNSVARSLVLANLAPAARSPFDRLSAREMEVVLLLLRGHGGMAIARHLRRSRKTVASHKANAFAKLGVNSVTSLARLAAQHALIEPASQ